MFYNTELDYGFHIGKQNHTLVTKTSEFYLKIYLNYFSLKVFSYILHRQQLINTFSYVICNQILRGLKSFVFSFLVRI